MPVLSAEELRGFCARLFEAAGTPPEEADYVAGSLVTSNLMGHDSHGVIRVIQYVDYIAQGMIVPGARLELTTPAGQALMMGRGHWGFGQSIAREATREVIARCREFGLAAITVCESNHIGRLGEYTAAIAEEGMLGLATANGNGAAQRVAPWGGREARLATNPISFAAPTGAAGRPVLVDLATSVVAEGKVRVARNSGKRLPEAWIMSANGEMTTDPLEFYGPPQGALMPLGGLVGHKGYALSVMIDLLSGAMTDAGTSRAGEVRIGNGFFIQAIDLQRLLPLDEFERRVGDFVAHVKSSPVAPGFDGVLMPGEPEYDKMETRAREGITVDEGTWAQLMDRATKLGVER